MLSSITPLGERGRNNRWWVTAVAYVAGSMAGGALIGTVCGGLGSLAPRAPLVALAALAVVALLGVLAELGMAGLRVPTNHRQVNERWLDLYRGWVYGVGFGFQLGLGVITIVTSAATYVVLAAAVFAHSAVGGLAVGATFGLARSLPVLLTASARTPGDLRALHRRNAAWALAVRRTALGGQAVTCGLAILAMMVAT